MKNALEDFATRFPPISTNELLFAIGPVRNLEPSGAPTNALALKTIPPEWNDREYRESAMEATVANLVAWQVRVNREQRGMTQVELAAAMGTQQSAISRLEDTESGDVQISTLVRVAHAFECAVVVKFVSYTEFAGLTSDVHPDRLYAEPFVAKHPITQRPAVKRRKASHG